MQNPPLIPFKVFGLQRTGTNLMVALMLRNFHAHYLETGTEWKHGPLQLPNRSWKGQPARFVLCVKNPYAWAVSCYRYLRNSCGVDPTVSLEFQSDPSVSFEEFLIRPSYGFASPIHHWNQMYRLWCNTLPPQRTAVVRQEDQLMDQVRVLEAVERQLGLSRRAAQLQAMDQKVDADSRLVGPMNREYYLNGQYLEEYSPTILDRINPLIDASLMRQFHYEFEPWSVEQRRIGPLRLFVRPCTSDAAEAVQVAADPLRLGQLKQQGHDIRTVVIAGAGISPSVLLAKGLWPQARVRAIESCPQKLRLLRMNTHILSEIKVIHAALAAGPLPSISPVSICGASDRCCQSSPGESNAGHASIGAISVQELLNELGHVDLFLMLGLPGSTESVLKDTIENRLIGRIERLAVGLPSERPNQQLAQDLSRTHTMEVWTANGATYLMASRRLP